MKKVKPLADFVFDAYGASDEGLVRHENEDAFRIHKPRQLYVVADGIGGLKNGARASRLAVKEVVSGFNLHSHDALERAVQRAHEAVYRINQETLANAPSGTSDEDLHLMKMGTTLTALHLRGSRGKFVHAGDSRLLRLRESSFLGFKFKQLNVLTVEHHTPGPEHGITQAVGVHENLHPQVGEFPVEHNDVFLLCSNGLTNYVGLKPIGQVLAKVQNKIVTPRAAAEELVRMANRTGGYDNVTALVVHAKSTRVKK